MSNSRLIIFVIVAIAIIVFSPIATIWSLNTLFSSLAIPYNIWTWLAVVWIHSATFGNITYQLSKK
jgi:hypothetical protein